MIYKLFLIKLFIIAINIYCLYIITAITMAYASSPQQNPPVPKSKVEALNSFKDRLKEENDAKLALEQEIKNIDKELTKTKDKLVKIASKIRQNENALKAAEQKIASLELKKTILQDQLNSDKASIASLILALERIRRTPPEALLARPNAPYEIAQSALLMGNIIPSINRHAEKINKKLEMLDKVTKELEKDKYALSSKVKKLKKDHSKMSSLIKKRNKLYSQISNDIKAREIAIQKISLQAKNLEDLIKRIKKEELEEQKRKKLAKIIHTTPSDIYRDKKIIDDGKAYIPISGIIRTSYKEKDELGAISNGITIEGRNSSIVIAPMAGKIQFTGSFKRYGKIVIIEHANGYHSLVAGLGNISAVVGEYIKAGEPIGILPNSSLISRPTIYYELRKDGVPINPAIKFPDLG